MQGSSPAPPAELPADHRGDPGEQRGTGTGDGTALDVVVGVDGTDCALGAVTWAAEEAARRSAPLRILHAASYLGRPRVAGADPPELPRARRIIAHAYTIARHAAPGVPARTELVPGEPVSALLRATATAQLLVLGVSTTGAMDELVLAPVALRVAARSAGPLVVVPHGREPDRPGRSIAVLLGLDEEIDDEPVVPFAVAAAQRTGEPLHILHARRARRRAHVDWTADPAAWRERFPDLTLQHDLLPGGHVRQLVAHVGPAQLIVVGAGGGRGPHRTLDSPHRWLLRHATAAVALVPPARRLTGLEPHGDIIALG